MEKKENKMEKDMEERGCNLEEKKMMRVLCFFPLIFEFNLCFINNKSVGS